MSEREVKVDQDVEADQVAVKELDIWSEAHFEADLEVGMVQKP